MDGENAGVCSESPAGRPQESERHMTDLAPTLNMDGDNAGVSSRSSAEKLQAKEESERHMTDVDIEEQLHLRWVG